MNTANDLQPLTDIFAPNTQASASPMKTQFYKQVAQIQLQQDENSDENRPATAPSLAKQAPARSKENWDSGYHGITDDEMDVDRMQSQASTATKEIEVDEAIPEESAVPAPAVVEERRTTNETFVSAREDASRKGSKEYSREVSTVPDEPVAEDEPVEEQQAPVVDVIPATQQTADEDLDQMDVDEPRSPSDASSPATTPPKEQLHILISPHARALGTEEEHWCEIIGSQSDTFEFPGSIHWWEEHWWTDSHSTRGRR